MKKATSPHNRSQRAPKQRAKSPAASDASRRIDARIKELPAWQGQALARLRALIKQAVPAVVEEWKWSVPVWSHPAVGIICTGETYKDKIKLTFARGATLEDPSGLFNSSLEGKTRRAIDLHEGNTINEKAFKSLIRAAADAPVKTTTPRRSAKPVKLLSGGNPQIAKADGDAAVQAYIAAMPDWKREVGRRLDALITRHIPAARKAIRWNTPFYGAKDPSMGWFLAFHCITKYVKVAFFEGSSLRPPPPVASKQKNVRYLHIHENDWRPRGPLDESQLTRWIKQAAKLPGMDCF